MLPLRFRLPIFWVVKIKIAPKKVIFPRGVIWTVFYRATILGNAVIIKMHPEASTVRDSQSSKLLQCPLLDCLRKNQMKMKQFCCDQLDGWSGFALNITRGGIRRHGFRAWFDMQMRAWRFLWKRTPWYCGEPPYLNRGKFCVILYLFFWVFLTHSTRQAWADDKSKMSKILEFGNYIWNNYEKCIQISTNIPSIGL